MDIITKNMNVLLGKKFIDEFVNFPDKDQDAITAFIEHVFEFGLENLEGKNKPSHDVDNDDPEYLKKVRFAVEHNLWHYHIGIVSYDMSKVFGKRTSEYVLHYSQMAKNNIGVVDYGRHPPFRLPSLNYLELENGTTV